MLGEVKRMARLSDVIEQIIKEMIDENNGRVEITRGELAEQVNCVPSQITYVLSTRFTTGQGYLVESRRGGGGWIRVKRILNEEEPAQYVMHVINSIGDSLTQHQASVYLNNFVDYKIVPSNVAIVMMAGLSDQALTRVPASIRDYVRMDLMKNMLMHHAMNVEDLDQADKLPKADPVQRGGANEV